MARTSWMTFMLAGAFITLPFSPEKILADYASQLERPQVVLTPAQTAKPRDERRGVALHIVRPGESLALLASQYGTSVEAIQKASGIKGERIQPGQELRIPFELPEREGPRLPPGVRLYRVQQGDTLEGIAKRFRLSILELVSANPALESLDHLPLGSQLLIPEGLKGRIVALSPGETLLDLALRYGIDPGLLAEVNGIDDPRALKPGDYVLLPHLQAKDVLARLEKKREEERRQLAERRRRLQLARARRQAELRRVSYRPGPSLKGFQWPLRSFRLTSYFGYRNLWVAGSNFHTGIDMAAPRGTPIYAAKSGRVVFAGWGYYFGRYVRIDHGDGVETLYAHMNKLAVRSGQYVKRGQVIGYVGASGKGALGVHLHFEVRVNRRPVNPMNYLPRR